jgi:hypothetical protein
MDEKTALIRQLCAHVGCIMEDSSVIALIWTDELPVEERLATLSNAAKDIATLITAAEVLLRR